MPNLIDFVKISDFEWELPVSFSTSMSVPVRIFATEKILEAALVDQSIQQAINAASLPGVEGHVAVMPDMHQGYGFPIGGVAATSYPNGVISPGGIGYDINCGVRLLASRIDVEEAAGELSNLAYALNHYCPTGLGVSGGIKLSLEDLKQVCETGSNWALKKGYATQQDLRRTEEEGNIKGADFKKLSERAKQRGLPQLGTLGSGNHFIEVDYVDEIFDQDAAEVMGLSQGKLVVMIHCGSRGLGHQVCSDAVQSLQSAVKKYGIHLEDRELVCAPINSPEGKEYLAAMRAAANFAFCNRQVLAHLARKAFKSVFLKKTKGYELSQVYDIAHNIGKIETHQIDGQLKKVCVHRKGATRAFGPNEIGIPSEFAKIGQPVLIPGSMGTSSWVMVGTPRSMAVSFGSSCHGAGRVMSRSKAKKTFSGSQLRTELSQKGIQIQAGSLAGLVEEAPAAYKDVDEVIEAVVGAGITKKVARLKPLVVVKG